MLRAIISRLYFLSLFFTIPALILFLGYFLTGTSFIVANDCFLQEQTLIYGIFDLF